MNKLPIVSISYHRNLEELKHRKDPEAVKAAAKELEAFFAYEMIKAMRETVNETSKNSFGRDTYMSMFDMELARLFADRGLGLKEMLLKGLNRKAQKADDRIKNPEIRMENSADNIRKAGNNINRHAEIRRPEKDHSLLNIEIKKTESIENIKEKSDEDLTVFHTHDPLTSEFPAPLTIKEPAAGRVNSSSEDISLPVDGKISSKYGMRRHPIYGDRRFHKGVDIAAPAGADIYPFRDGMVIFSGSQPGYGNVVIIDHGDGYLSKYAHNKANLVKEGDMVDTEMIIAKVGSTGLTTGPHLHFEVKYNDKRIDPVRVLAMR